MLSSSGVSSGVSSGDTPVYVSHRASAKSYKVASSTSRRSMSLVSIRKAKASKKTSARRNVEKSTMTYDELQTVFDTFIQRYGHLDTPTPDT